MKQHRSDIRYECNSFVAILTTDSCSGLRYSTRMKFSAANQWVAEIIDRKMMVDGVELGQAELARRLTKVLGREIDRAAVNKMCKGPRSVQADEMLAIEMITKIPVPSQYVVTPAPLISWVSAGKPETPEFVSEIENAKRVSAPDLDPGGEWIALTVDGDSMDRISPPDSIIFVNLRDRRLVPNACYIIANEVGAASYKRYRPGKWEPVSTNKKHKTYHIKPGNEPRVVGRVRKTILSM